MYNLIEKRPDPSKEFLLVRHGQDNDTLDTNLNQPLIPDSINQIEGIVSRVKVIFSTEITFTVVYGPSKRTSQTAQHLAGTLSKFGYNLDLQEDADIKEFYQGQFHVDHSLLTNGRYVPLETAWEIFNNKILDGQIHYRFGDPIVNTDGEPTFPLLQSFFIIFIMSNTTSETVIRNGQEVKFIWHPGEILENVILHQVYGFLMTSNNLVVLVRDKEEKRFTLPGGKIENGETARNALIRECLEEAQIQLSNPVLLGSLEYINPNGKDDEDKHHQEIRYFSVVDNFKKFEPLKDG